MDQEMAQQAKEQIEEMFGKREPLHPDLRRWIEEDDTLGTCIKHPLVFSMMHNEMMNAMINRAYTQKKNACDEAWNEGKYHSYVFLHERPYRLDAFVEAADNADMSDEMYWDLLGDIWTDSENIYQDYEGWELCLMSDRPGRENIMSEDERKEFEALPEQMTIWRGYNGTEYELQAPGFSWTLDRKRAVWFAQRFESHRGPAFLAEATINKQDVIAHFTGRGEQEIVCLPHVLKDVKIQKIGEKNG